MYSFTHSAMYIFMYSSIYISGKVALPSRTPLTSAPAAMVSSRHPSFLSLSLSSALPSSGSLCLSVSHLSRRACCWNGAVASFGSPVLASSSRQTCSGAPAPQAVQRCARPAHLYLPRPSMT